MKYIFSTIVLMLILTSCSVKDENITNVKDHKLVIVIDTTNPYNSLGLMHNELLTEHFDAMHPHDYDCMAIFADTVLGEEYVKLNYRDSLYKHMGDYLHNNYLIPLADLDSAKNKLNSFLIQTSIVQTIGGKQVFTTVLGKFATILLNLKNDNIISTFEYNELLPIMQKGDLSDWVAVDSLISNINVSNYDNDSNDDAILQFKAVYQYSTKFWDNHHGSISHKKDNMIQAPSYIRTGAIGLADGVFGVFGTAFGVFGGAFLGAGASALTDFQFSQMDDIGCCCGSTCPC